jgi:hypothetical protein
VLLHISNLIMFSNRLNRFGGNNSLFSPTTTFASGEGKNPRTHDTPEGEGSNVDLSAKLDGAAEGTPREAPQRTAVEQRADSLCNIVKIRCNGNAAVMDQVVTMISVVVDAGLGGGPDSMSAAEVAEMLNTEQELAEAMLGYLADGSVKVSVVANFLIASNVVQCATSSVSTPSSPGLSSGDVKGVAEQLRDAITPAMKALSPPTPSGPLVTDVRSWLQSRTPVWWFNLDGKKWGKRAFPLPSFFSVMTTAPIEHMAVRTSPLFTHSKFAHILTHTSSRTEDWPGQRNIFFHEMSRIFGHHAGCAYLAGSSPDAAICAGEQEVLHAVQNAVMSLPSLAADAYASLRALGESATGEIILALLTAIDLSFCPLDSASHLTWSNAVPKEGATGMSYFTSLCELAGKLGYPFDMVTERFQSAILNITLNSSAPYTDRAAMVGNVFNTLVSSGVNTMGGARAGMTNNPLFLSVLVPASNAAGASQSPAILVTHPQQQESSPAPPAGKFSKPLRKGYNNWIIHQQCKAAGLNPSPVTSPVPDGNCFICKLLGKTQVPYVAGQSWTAEQRRTQVSYHNSWRCMNANEIKDKIMGAKPSLKCEDILVEIDNPNAVWNAGSQ